MNHLMELTEVIVSSMNEINLGLNEIGISTLSIKDLSDVSGDSIASLDELVSQFKI